MRHRQLSSLLLLGLGALLPASLKGSEKLPLTIEKSWEFKRIGSPSLSPDGKWAVAPVATANMKESKLETDLWLFSTDGKVQEQLTTHAADDANPAFSPDGRYLAFTAKRDGDKTPQLYVLPIGGGEARRVTNVPTGISEVRWFPDSQKLAFVSRIWPELKTWDEQGKRLAERDESKMTAKVWDTIPVTSWDIWVDERQAHVYSIKLTGGEPEAITLKAGVELTRAVSENESGRYDISADGKSIAFVTDTDPSAAKANIDVLLLRIGESKAKNITTDNPASDSSPRFSPDGRYLAYLKQSIPGFYGDTRRLVLADADGSDARVLFSTWDRSVGDVQWAQDGQTIYSVIDDAGMSRLYELPLKGQPRPVTTSPSFGAVQASKGQNLVLVGLRQSFVEAPTLVRIDPRNGASTPLSRLNDSLQNSIAWGKYESVTYKGADGKDVQMWVNYPPNFDKSKRYPLFLMLHGGPHNGITDGMHWRWNAQIFASQGYVTAWHNFHGSSGFGQAFTDSINPDWVSKPYEDTIKAAEWFQQQAWIDKTRMIAGGGSYGGFLASTLLGREHPFKALIAHAAVYNLYTQYAADFAYTARRHGDFWENPEIFAKTSPHLQAANFKTPTLVIHGQLDYRVPVTHGIELYHTLKRLGVPSRFVYYPNENHWILKPQNSVFWYQEVTRWLQQYAPINGKQPEKAVAGSATASSSP
jgi:dipeptidyl aminopeptidase/acylaminoacyl peptidase